MLKLVSEPKVTLVSAPTYFEVPHLTVECSGESTDSELLSEFAGRLCYMSQANPANRTTRVYINNIKAQRHGSVLEHANFSVLLEGVSRTLTHELVRHRAGFAYSQLSQRYVDESDTEFVIPPALLPDPGNRWRVAMQNALTAYQELVEVLMPQYAHLGSKVEQRKRAREAARSVLPNATETKVVITANARAWRHFFTMRGGEGADLEIRRAAIAIYKVLHPQAPSFFDDFTQSPHPTGIDVLTSTLGHV